MAPLLWESWHRSEGCRNWMDKTKFAGTSFSTIFWNAMRGLFYDEHKKPGLVYQGKVHQAAQDILRKFPDWFTDQKTQLLKGNFAYPPLVPLLFTGPDKEDIGHPNNCIWSEGTIPGNTIEVNFYNIVSSSAYKTVNIDFPKDATGIGMMTWFTGSVVMHGIMHNHGFRHPLNFNWHDGPQYLQSVPHLAAAAVLLASPYAAYFANTAFLVPWRHAGFFSWCEKCQGLWVSSNPDHSVCPQGGTHVKTGSGEYSLSDREPLDGEQGGWKHCDRCHGLFFAQNGPAGVCPRSTAGTPHYPEPGALTYSLTLDQSFNNQQQGWRWCAKCYGLFFEEGGPGVCPARDGHSAAGSGRYGVTQNV